MFITDNYFQYRSALLKLKAINKLENYPEKDIDVLLNKMDILWEKLTLIERSRINQCSSEVK